MLHPFHDPVLQQPMLLCVVTEDRLDFMKIHYDRTTDTMVIALRDDRIRESAEVRPGVIADFGYDGGIVRFEILDACKHVEDPLNVTLATAS